MWSFRRIFAPHNRIERTRALCLLLVLVSIALLNLACVSHTAFNTKKEDYLRTYVTEGSTNTYSIAVIEFDDHGELWNPVQLQDAVKHIRLQSRNSSNGVVVVIFIHGWKNNASWNKGRLPWLEREMEKNAEKTKDQLNRPIPFIGVYLGWRGKASTIPFLKQATFWNRIMAARRVASLSMTETLIKLSYAAATENPKSKSVVIGHSMGGLILERTLSHALVPILMFAEVTDYSPVDLVIGVNSASPAVQTKQAVESLKRNRARLVVEDGQGNISKAKGPLMVSITSETDKATRVIFPFGQWFTSLFLRYRDYDDPSVPSQRMMANHTPGHVPYLHSHSVEVKNGNILIHELENRYNDTPYWVMRVPKEIIPDHNNLDSPLVDQLFSKLISMNDIYDPEVKVRLVTDSSDWGSAPEKED